MQNGTGDAGSPVAVITGASRGINRVLALGLSKAALESASAILAAELQGSGVTLNVINPGGPVNTPMVARSDRQQQDLLISPEIMVKPVCWLASRAADQVNGRRITATQWNEAAPEAAMTAIGWPQLAADSTWQPPK